MAPLSRSDTTPYLHHIRTTGLNLVSLPSTACISTRTRPLSVSPSSDWLRLFLAHTFSRINTPKISSRLGPVILPAYTAYEDGTGRSETSAYKSQAPGNHPKERILHTNRYFPAFSSRPADILLGHRNCLQRKDHA